MIRRILVLVLPVLWLVGCRTASYPPGAEGIGDAYYPQLGNGGYDALHYTLELAIDPQSNTLSGTCTRDIVKCCGSADLERIRRVCRVVVERAQRGH